MYKYIYILAIMLIWSNNSAQAQSIPKEARNYLEEGKLFYDQANYLKALDSYLAAYAFVPTDPGINYSIPGTRLG